MEFNMSGQIVPHYLTISNELNIPKLLVCSSDKARKPVKRWEDLKTQNISYFVGLDALPADPNSILSGDRNITGGIPTNGNLMLFGTNTLAGWRDEIHGTIGYIGLGDGSAQLRSQDMLRKQLQFISNGPIRLAIP